MDTPDFLQPSGSNPPGLGNKFLASERSWITTFPNVPSQTNYGDIAEIVGDIVFALGKGFREFYTTIGEQELMAKRVGQRDSKGFLIDFDFFTPGNSNDLSVWFSEDKNFTFLIEDANCDVPTMYLMGAKCLSAVIEEGEWKSGKAMDPNSRKGWVGKLRAYMTRLTKYSGDITLYP